MALQTGENEQALRKIVDLTRLIAIALLLLHFYSVGYAMFTDMGWHHPFFDHLLLTLYRTGLFRSLQTSKMLALGFLLISLVGGKGKKEEKITLKRPIFYMAIGLSLYFSGDFVNYIPASYEFHLCGYIIISSLGFLIFLMGGTWISRVITAKIGQSDIFNQENETFPQNEELLENEYSINLPSTYRLRKRERKSWINIINPFRGILVLGSPGSGKSYFIIRHIISQHIQKGFSMFIYDFKFDDLTTIAYNHYLRYNRNNENPLKFYSINFDDLSRSSRCNPIDPSSMFDITDAAESARTILLGLNREWIKRQGDFFVESPINFLTAIIWYLRRYNQGEFCTLPHVIELLQLDYDTLFSLLRADKEIEVLVNPFINAYLNDAMDQLEGQIASAKITLARLTSPQLYYILSGNDFNLDINNPQDPKIVTMGNNPQKIQIYGAVLSLYINRLVKLVNQKGKVKSSLIFDEFPTIYLNNIDSLIATARDNLVSTTLAIQDLSQLRKDYGREQSDVIMNISGNLLSGQVSGDTAKQLSERFGKILQDRESYSLNSSDTSISRSKQLESAIPASKISSLSSGEFVGIIADNPQNRIKLKAFHCCIVNDHIKLKKEIKGYKEIPEVRQVTLDQIAMNFNQIKKDIEDLAFHEIRRISDTPSLAYLLIKK